MGASASRLALLCAAVVAAAPDPEAKHAGVLHPTELQAQPASTASFSADAAAAYVSTFRIMETHPHCETTPCRAFTEGLAFDEAGTLFESNGGYNDNPYRGLRRVDPATGRSVGQTLAPQQGQFVEGLAVMPDGRMVQLTYREHQINEYRNGAPAQEVQHVRTVAMPAGPAEGWGLTRSADGSTLYMTDSTQMLFHINATSLEVIRSVPLHDPRLGASAAASAGVAAAQQAAGTGRTIWGANELELVGDEVWANVYPTCAGSGGTRVICDHSECIARINPESGEVVGWIDLTSLLEHEPEATRATIIDSVLNGIAYHAPSDRLLVTGKNWQSIYRVAIEPTQHDASHVQSVCRLAD